VKTIKYLLAMTVVTSALTLSASANFMKNEGPGGERVPDNGATVMLLGGALVGLGLVRHYLKR